MIWLLCCAGVAASLTGVVAVFRPRGIRAAFGWIAVGNVLIGTGGVLAHDDISAWVSAVAFAWMACRWWGAGSAARRVRRRYRVRLPVVLGAVWVTVAASGAAAALWAVTR